MQSNSAKLGKTMRLKSSKLIGEVLVGRRSETCYPLRLVWKEISDGESTVAAFFAPKKHYPRAVDRNRVKRRMREAYRCLREEKIGGCPLKFALIFICISAQVPDYADLKKSMDKLLTARRKKIQTTDK